MLNTLEVTDLEASFQSEYGSTRALENISFHIKQGEVLALVGESGSGKTVTSLSIMGLLPSNGQVNNGEIVLLSKNNQEINIDYKADITQEDILVQEDLPFNKSTHEQKKTNKNCRLQII